MRKYGLIISFIIALTFVGCAMVFVRHDNRHNSHKHHGPKIERKLDHKHNAKKHKVGGERGK
jgi:hypothetical protein